MASGPDERRLPGFISDEVDDSEASGVYSGEETLTSIKILFSFLRLLCMYHLALRNASLSTATRLIHFAEWSPFLLIQTSSRAIEERLIVH